MTGVEIVRGERTVRSAELFGGGRHIVIITVVTVIVRCVAAEDVDLGHLEAGNGDVEIELQVSEASEFDRESFVVPTGVEGQLVVGNDIGADLLGRQIVDPNGWDLVDAKQPGCLDAAVTGDDRVVAIEEDGRVHPVKILAAGARRGYDADG